MKPPPTVQLKNGIIVANFSSPHEFKFDDGSVLPACDEERVNALSLKQEENERPNYSKEVNWIDVSLDIHLSDEVYKELEELHKLTYCRGYSNPIDIIIVPFMVLQAVREGHEQDRTDFDKIRVIRMVDRVNKIASSSKFCI